MEAGLRVLRVDLRLVNYPFFLADHVAGFDRPPESDGDQMRSQATDS